ncbi:MAG: radical SAM protein [Candidatus Goldbacteria bacterium]|nr:radical SAM protein [Candidatus Goldiibacteriota bacterium]
MKPILKNLESPVTQVINKSKKNAIIKSIELFIDGDTRRELLFNKIKSQIKKEIYKNKESGVRYVKEVKVQFLASLINQANKNIRKGFFSKEYAKRIMRNMMGIFYNEKDEIRKKLKETTGDFCEPAFCTISPTQNCNLNCIGCYAASQKTKKASLPYPIVERIVNEMDKLVGSNFIVISGGEPFVWKDEGKGIIDIAEKFSNMFFLVYTNGLLLDDEKIERLFKTANMTPAISVEGYEEETDKRRGKGIYKKILETMERMKKYGFPFGVSVTATRDNINILLDEKFYDWWFEEVGVSYMWMFHLMPIGRARDCMDLMITPEQRKELLMLWEHLLFKKNYFIGDFWNSGAASDGCIAYGRRYFYIDWHGNIMPCVFIPYYKDNVYDLYKNGGTIVDTLMSDYFKKGRKWQKDYLSSGKKTGNLFAPCSIRDHHRYFRENILSSDVKPENEDARLAIEDPEYFKSLCEFDKKLQELTDPLWQDRLKK